MFRAGLGGSGEIGQRQRNAPEALEHDFLGRRGFAWRRGLSRHHVARHDARQSLRQADARSQGSRHVTACHELCEMLIDPMATLWCEGPRSTLWAYEVCDAVEEETFEINGIVMSDFVFPAYFDLFRLKRPGSAQYDYLKRVRRPFHILKGGKFGSRDKAKRFALEDRRWHRSQFRKRNRANW